MNINRQNYEEFFLMYVDNELTDSERIQVHTFVQQNEDLAEELALLQESVVFPDNIIFPAKDSLYKSDDSINLNNYEEYFLLDVDNELSEAEKADVEKFVLQHPKLQEEYTLLLKTKLQPEVFRFKNKALLYRTAVKDRRVIPIGFSRLAVAASVIGLIACLWILNPDNPEYGQSIAATEKPVTGMKDKTATPKVIQPAGNEMVSYEKTQNNRILPASKARAGSTINAADIIVQKIAFKKLPSKDPERSDEIFASINPKHETKTLDDKITVYEPVKTDYGLALNTSNTNVKTATSFTTPAVYKEVDTDDEENSVLIGSVEINKNKLRGLMKKATNLFDKKARTNDSEKTIHIASFEIKTK